MVFGKNDKFFWFAIASFGGSALLVMLGGNLNDNTIIGIGFYMGFISVFVLAIIIVLLPLKAGNTNIQNDNDDDEFQKSLFKIDTSGSFDTITDPACSSLPGNLFNDPFHDPEPYKS